MTEANSTPSILDNAALKRAWLAGPLAMTGWLVLLAYFIAWLVAWQMAAGEFDRLPSYAKHRANGAGWYLVHQIGLYTPLAWGLLVSLIGFIFGAVGMGMAEERTQAALRFTFFDDTHPLTQRVHRMAARLDLPPPKVGYMQAVNAFAVGTNQHDASVILGIPLINRLNPDELDAVIGHELGHIASGDMRRMVFAEGYQNLFAAVAGFIGAIVAIILQVAVKSGHMTGSGASLAHQFGNLGRMTLGAGSEFFIKSSSRNREFYADAVGAAMASPDAMSRALQRLGNLTEKSSPAESKYAYLMIKGFSGGAFSTHPSTVDRVAALAAGTYLDRMTAAHAGRQQRRAQARAMARKAGVLGISGAVSAARGTLGVARRARTWLSTRKRPASTSVPPRKPAEKNRQRPRIEPRF